MAPFAAGEKLGPGNAGSGKTHAVKKAMDGVDVVNEGRAVGRAEAAQGDLIKRRRHGAQGLLALLGGGFGDERGRHVLAPPPGVMADEGPGVGVANLDGDEAKRVGPGQ